MPWSRLILNADPPGGGSAPPSDPPPSSDAPPTDKAEAGMQQALAAERAKRQALESRLAEIEKSQADAAEAARIANGEAADVAKAKSEALEAANAKIAEYEARETARLEAITKANAESLKALPEHMRPLVPEGLSPEAAQAQIAKLAKLAAMPPDGAPEGFRSRHKQDGDADIPPEALAEAQKYGMDPRKFYEKVWVPRQKRNKR